MRRSQTGEKPHILILGGGYVGMYTALGLQKKFRRGQVNITVVDPRSYMTYQPFLPEAAAGSLEPRHVVVPLRRVLKRCDVITGHVESIDHASRTVRITPEAAATYDLRYDVLVLALGSVARTLDIPGLADFGIGFKQVEEAIALRNHVLDRLDVAASTDDPDVRRRALTFVFVGGARQALRPGPGRPAEQPTRGVTSRSSSRARTAGGGRSREPDASGRCGDIRGPFAGDQPAGRAD